MNENIYKKLKNNISEEELINFIENLVKIPSYNGIVNQETKVAEHIQQIFLKEGIDSEIVPVIDGRSNVIAKIKGNGKGKTLLLTGHMDTVPPYDMTEPFEIKNDGDRLVARGVVDMKGPLACMIYSMISLKRANVKLDGDIIFAGVIDEEEKSLGTIDLLERGVVADAAIVGEPTNLNICVAHRGLEWFELQFHGKTVHGGAQKEGINAILSASKFIQKTEDILIPKIEKETHSIIGTSSMNYGTINGGTQPSTVAGECVMKFDRRWVPGVKYDDVVNEYKDVIKELSNNDNNFKCTLKVVDESVMKEGYVHESMETDINHPIVNITKYITNEVFNISPEITYFPAWSDGGLLSSYGNIPTIVFAPGDLTTAHSSVEQLEIKQILPATLIYALIAIEYCK
ncbi:acetylornithine deacetylase/succinyl-diaminopimelate desuccinylase [Sedimentibacter acidaminivorans]|uniref:Probable succinyl-diaminopimelate desuccinylase n=1 Tax=Sedimentibacter acidaminivorans TaxID=913099 RepID=A0ABS4GEG0_9FIRM|nr:M20 family metallopeptidase [Sedimentibacter acidaminivorans]MBP1926083.1 acetylornithine deacetylase/succinyl-diaminopimelate desuccinylase [Sedimentibacter acidaminivorans]